MIVALVLLALLALGVPLFVVIGAAAALAFGALRRGRGASTGCRC